MRVSSVFISYSSENVDVAERIERALQAKSFSVWRDNASLHAGEKWPKRLGEAIAGVNALVLLWSKAAANSEFVELEWNIALALRKPVLPYVLDTTTLPPTLRPLHLIKNCEVESAAEQVAQGLLVNKPEKSEVPKQAVIDRLAAIREQDPSDVLQTAKTVFAQQGWIVHGPVYQATGDINITYADQETKANKKPWSERWQTWVGIVVGVLTAITLGKQIFFSSTAPGTSISSAQSPSQQNLPNQNVSGGVVDEEGKPVVGATVTIVVTGETTQTDDGGRFSLLTSARPGDEIRLEVTKGELRSDIYYAVGVPSGQITLTKDR